jgi:molybdate transport system substrate-binding protein
MLARLRLLFLVCPLVWATLPVRAEDLSVAVAANFIGTLQKLTPLFMRAHGHSVVASPGSSGQLYAQIEHGAPYDVLLSADRERPAQLEAAGLSVPGTRFTYARGQLVLWSAKPNANVEGKPALQRADVQHVAIADPKAAPYGAAAERVLSALGLLAPLRAAGKIVIGASVAQAYEFAATGHAELAFVSRSQVLGPDGHTTGSTWLVPEKLYGALDQDAVLLAHATKPAIGKLFLDWLHHDPEALGVLRATGYEVPKP